MVFCLGCGWRHAISSMGDNDVGSLYMGDGCLQKVEEFVGDKFMQNVGKFSPS